MKAPLDTNDRNFRRRRDRLMAEIRKAHLDVQRNLHPDSSQGKRARTLAIKRLWDRARDLYHHMTP